MDTYTSDAMSFFMLVLTSGLIAVMVLSVACAISFTVAFVLFRERSLAPQSAESRVAFPTIVGEPRDRLPVVPAFAAHSPAAMA
jgi:hypothetical protein